MKSPVLLIAAALALLACAPEREVVQPPWFTEVAASAGLDFVHVSGATGEFYYPELMQPGCAFLDFDDDGWQDVYAVQSGPLPVDPASSPVGNRLFRNLGDGTFADVTESAGVGDTGYGVGVAAADYDNDGDVDLYVTNLGPNVLYRNEGDGSFTDVSAQAGVADPGYGSSVAFVDVDADGDLDLYVANYLDWTPAIERPCYAPNGLRGYCSPGVYERPARDTLYRNEGDGTFTDVSVESGIAGSPGTGLGVVTGDFDGDGRVDIYVANDQMENFLWLNRGDGRFAEEALARGCALNGFGRAEAGMGVVAQDIDADGDLDLFMTHLGGETNTFYRNRQGLFEDTTDEMLLGSVSQPYTGFGTGLIDYDRDGFDDVFIANGRVRLGDEMREGDYAEPNQLLRGLPDGTFEDVSDAVGPALALVEISRGAAFGDVDNDGDVDILVANNDGPLRLLRNEGLDDHHWLRLETRCPQADRNCIGAVVEVEAGGRLYRRQVQPASSYCSSNDPRLLLGLGTASVVDRLRVTWPDGRVSERTNVAVDQALELQP